MPRVPLATAMVAVTRSTCDWPGCGVPASAEVPILPGMTLTIEGVAFTDAAFGVCDTHAPRMASLVLDRLDEAERREAARRNLAPGDTEWNDYFGHE